MAWTIEFADSALRQLRKLDRTVQQRIWKFVQRFSQQDNPRSAGEALHGERLGEFWKYRVGDYRLIVRLEDQRLLILVLKIGHRRDVYR